MFLQKAALCQLHGQSQTGLTAQSGQQTIRLCFQYNALQCFLLERLHVYLIGHCGIGHYGRGV